jgi:vacuolar-type H+-ATPase subunit H
MICETDYYYFMRSELLNHIFTVEQEAEQIVQEAQKEVRSIVNAATEAGEHALSTAVEAERSKQQQLLADAQQAASEANEKEKKRLAAEEEDDEQLHECATQIAEKVITMLGTTSLGGT